MDKINFQGVSFCYRLQNLLQEIECGRDNKTIIFVETKKKVDNITWKIRQNG